MAKVYEFLANGFEEIEGLAPVDILRRGGVDIKTVSITGTEWVETSHGITIKADLKFEDIQSFEDADMLLLPGGMPGTLNLGNCKLVTDTVTEYFNQGKRVAAICAAPSILGDLGILNGKRACSYPGFEDRLAGAATSENEVEHDGTVTTSRGLGTAIPFALSLIEQLTDAETVAKIKESIIFKH